MDAQRRTLGERDPNTLRSELALARTLKAQDKLGELIELYDAWGKPEKAAEYRALLQEAEEAEASD